VDVSERDYTRMHCKRWTRTQYKDVHCNADVPQRTQAGRLPKAELHSMFTASAQLSCAHTTRTCICLLTSVSSGAAINFYDFRHSPSPHAPVSSGAASTQRSPARASAPVGRGLAKQSAHTFAEAQSADASASLNRKREVDAEVIGRNEQRHGSNRLNADSSRSNAKATDVPHFGSASKLSPGGVQTIPMSRNSTESKMELAQQLLDHLLGQYFKKSDTFRALVSSVGRTDIPTDVVSKGCQWISASACGINTFHLH
jgi:hypothetical protein